MDKRNQNLLECYKCHQYFDISNFGINTRQARGFQSYCKTCKSVCYQEWKAKNVERKKLIDKKSRVKNAENIKIQKREWYLKNTAKEKERLKKYMKPKLTKEDKYLKMGILEAAYKPFVDAIRKIMQKEKRYKKHKIYNKSEKAIKSRQEREKSKYKNDIKYMMNRRMKNIIGKHLRGEKCGRHWENIVGWKIEDLIKHLSLQFNSEMNWNNYGKYWHVDHIIPISSFNFKTDKDLDFKRCWSLMNLQPLEARENLKKSNKILRQYYGTREKLMMLVS